MDFKRENYYNLDSLSVFVVVENHFSNLQLGFLIGSSQFVNSIGSML